MNETKRIVIFGATGGIGVYAATHLIERGYAVEAIGHRTEDNNFYEELGANYYSVDISSKDTFEVLPKENVYAVIHLAGMLPARMKGYNPQQYIDMNVTGTLNVLDYAVSCGIKRFVYANSWSDLAYLADEQTIIPNDGVQRFPLNNDHSVYSIMKNAGAFMCEHYAARFGFLQFTLRFPNIYMYNPRNTYYVDGQIRYTGLGNIINQIIKGEDVELWGDPNRVRDMVYVKDCVQIIEKCLVADSKGGTFNVGTGIGTTRYEQIQGLIDVFASPEIKKPKIIINREKPDSPQYIMDITKTKWQLGYEPQYDYLTFLQDYKQEMESNRFEKILGV